MVFRLLSRGLLISGALYAGLVSEALAQPTHVWVSDAEGSQQDLLCGGRFRNPEDVADCWYGPGRPGAPDEGPHTCQLTKTNNGHVNPEYWVLTISSCGKGTTFTRWRMYCPPAEGSPRGTGTVWGECIVPPPSPCEQFAGVEIGRFYEGTETQAQVCANPPASEVNECAATAVGAPFCNDGFCYGTLRFTGAPCTDEPPVGEDDQIMSPPSNNNCITSGTVSVCFSKSDKNCGLVNGEPWCASAMPSNGCVSTESGAVVCTVDAWSAPTEPDGVTPAEPDGVFVVGAENGGQTYEYFRRETVASL